MREKNIHRLFEISIILKGLNALLELITAVVTLALNPAAVSNFLLTLAKRESGTASHDFLASLLVYAAATISQASQRFAGIYLAAHGVINLGIVVGLLAGALWTYPTALAAIAGFIAYQLYRYVHTGSITLILLTIFDIAVWWLVWHEYQLRRRPSPDSRSSEPRSA